MQVDIDEQEIGRNYPIEWVSWVMPRRWPGSCSGCCGKSTRTDAQGRMARPKSSHWPRVRRARLETELALTGDPMMPQRVYPELRKVLPRDCMVTLDAGVAPGLTYDRFNFDLPRTFFNYSGQGGLGMGYCVGLGTKARPARPAGGEHPG